LAEFIIESVETLARIANTERPPLEREELMRMRTEFMTTSDPAKEKKLRAKMKAMKDAFGGGRGDLSSWGPDVLTEIDNCFVKAYLVKGEPHPCLFFPQSPENMNKFLTYCGEVDVILRQRSKNVPVYAKEYFAYFTIYHMQDYKFPVPLGTKSVVNALHKIAESLKDGFTEVSRRFRFRARTHARTQGLTRARSL
jgi:hypothetical protein